MDFLAPWNGPGFSVRLSSERCSYTSLRLRPGVVFIRIQGDDKGQLGEAPRDELREDISRYAPIELFFEMDESTARTGELIRVYLEPQPFEEALQRAAPDFPGLEAASHTTRPRITSTSHCQ